MLMVFIPKKLVLIMSNFKYNRFEKDKWLEENRMTDDEFESLLIESAIPDEYEELNFDHNNERMY